MIMLLFFNFKYEDKIVIYLDLVGVLDLKE